MKMKISFVACIVLITALLTIGLIAANKKVSSNNTLHEPREEAQAAPAENLKARAQYEFNMLKDPTTGLIPAGIYAAEQAFARQLPERSYGIAPTGANGTSRAQANNNYIPAGPNNIGGRTRAVAYDKRYNGTTNKVIISGSVSGGIMRSADGGLTWTRVSPENEIHNLTTLAQDPTTPDTWYAGGGEPYGNTADELGAAFLGYGVYKSTNNGVSWTRLTLSITAIGGGSYAPGTLEAFDHPFDFVHKIAVSPTNGYVYISCHRRLVRSTDGGATFNEVFLTNTSAFASNGQSDVAVSNVGIVVLAVNGGAALDKRGIWVSQTGDANSFTRVAGGSTLNVDSVAGWRAGSYDVLTPASGGSPAQYASKRILVASAPSNNNIAYVYYENGLSSDNLVPEADLFKLTIAGASFTWTNLSANMPDFAGGNLTGSDPLTIQGGYDMEIAVKPDDPNFVVIGGTNLYRSTDGFATTNNTAWIGGYVTSFTYGQYPNSHSDMHKVMFCPSNTSQLICGNDGGLQETQNAAASSVAWTMIPNYQTLQCYNVAMDPGAGRNNFASGSQDNGIRFRDATGVLGTLPIDSNNHNLLFSADGAYVGIGADNAGTQYLYESIQFGKIYRARLTSPFTGGVDITPTGLTTYDVSTPKEFGEFVTNFRLESDNSSNIYYVNYNRLFRTTASTAATQNNWTELTGVSAAVNPTAGTDPRTVGIRGVGYSRGPYTTGHVLYFGTTSGKIFRLDDPQNATASKQPVNITPSGLLGNVQDIATNPNNDDEVIAVVSNYGQIGIWWTKNGKSASPTWKNAEGNLTLPSFRSCAIVVKKDATNQPVTEYYVGTSIGLYSTVNLSTVLDAGQAPTWQREGGNVLNYALITSLAYRPVDNVLLVGTHGNGLYYTNIGTPNFTPNLNTGITPITNNRTFIRSVYPTVSSNTIQYQIGDLLGVRKLSVQLISMNGQTVFNESRGYQNGTVPLERLSTGAYILYIASDDNKYRHVQKIVKQ